MTANAAHFVFRREFVVIFRDDGIKVTHEWSMK